MTIRANMRQQVGRVVPIELAFTEVADIHEGGSGNAFQPIQLNRALDASCRSRGTPCDARLTPVVERNRGSSANSLCDAGCLRDEQKAIAMMNRFTSIRVAEILDGGTLKEFQ